MQYLTDNGIAMLTRSQRNRQMAYRIWIVLVILVTTLSLIGNDVDSVQAVVKMVVQGAVAACLPGAIIWAITGRKPAL